MTRIGTGVCLFVFLFCLVLERRQSLGKSEENSHVKECFSFSFGAWHRPSRSPRVPLAFVSCSPCAYLCSSEKRGKTRLVPHAIKTLVTILLALDQANVPSDNVSPYSWMWNPCTVLGGRPFIWICIVVGPIPNGCKKRNKNDKEQFENHQTKRNM